MMNWFFNLFERKHKAWHLTTEQDASGSIYCKVCERWV